MPRITSAKFQKLLPNVVEMETVTGEPYEKRINDTNARLYAHGELAVQAQAPEGTLPGGES